MAGRRLLDAATLLAATRSVAKQHVRIRQQQFDVWNQTSSVARAARDRSDAVARGFKEQTGRVTLTAKAAGALLERLDERAPGGARDAAQRVRESAVGTGTGRREDERTHSDRAAGGRDNSFAAETPRDESARNGVSKASLDAGSQSETPRYSYRGEVQETLDPAQQAKAEAPPHQGAALQPEAESQDVQASAYDDVPEGVNIDVFQNPKIKKLLGDKTPPARQPVPSKQPSGQSKDEVIRRTEKESPPEAFGRERQNPLEPRRSPIDVENSQQHTKSVEHTHSLASDIAQEIEKSSGASQETRAAQRTGHVSPDKRQMHESSVPSSRVGRIWQYSGLATSMAFGAVGESFRRVTGSGDSAGSLMLSAGNMERLVAKLSRMRGAALKLGQMMSFQDSKMLPAPIHEVLQRVQDNADYMPPWQRNSVLASNLGDDWRSFFSTFDEVPMAAASVGQVHKATLASIETPVAVKIQYPGVATSITSDLNNLSILLTASRLLPKGLFLDKTIANARTELAWECDYIREASCQTRFRELLADETDVFTVPAVFEEACGPQVLTAEFMSGTAVTKPSLDLTQAQKDWIGTNILRLCLRELTEFNFMQTDPNWTNFLFNKSIQRLELLDFGAAREYPEKFVDPYVRNLIAAAAGDRAAVRDLSIQLGYLTGKESRKMLDAHVDSVMTLAEPFRETNDVDAVYDFRDQTITDRVRGLIPVMVRERLAPPPEETYSLHRKLSGAFLLLARLGSRVRCREMFVRAVEGWRVRKGER